MKYLIRLDDACETMDLEKWFRIEKLFDKYNIKPLVSVIPNNLDESLNYNTPYGDFWFWLRQLEKKKWVIGLHGNDHIYLTKFGGINPIHKRSEFAGISLIEQQNKIRAGYNKMISNGIFPTVFVAPSHTFDDNTLKAIYLESEIRTISDTIAFFPYLENDFLFMPQQFGSVRKIPISGLFTFCYHPNTMEDSDFNHLEKFLRKQHNNFTSFNQIDNINNRKRSNLDNLYSFFYFTFRKLFR
jgi:hypothetical protein